jgi:hypothetical protein
VVLNSTIKLDGIEEREECICEEGEQIYADEDIMSEEGEQVIAKFQLCGWKNLSRRVS